MKLKKLIVSFLLSSCLLSPIQGAVIEYKPPTAADYITYNSADIVINEGHIQYADNSPLFLEALSDYRFLSSSNQDEMIYTTLTASTYNGVPIVLLLIIDPTTTNLIAASITYPDRSNTLYTFYDDNGTTIYNR